MIFRFQPNSQPTHSRIDTIAHAVSHHRTLFALVCAIVGIVVGCAAVLFNYAIAGWSYLTTGYMDYTAVATASYRPPHGFLHFAPWFLIIVPVISALIYGPMIHRHAPSAKGHGIPEVMLAVKRKGGRIPGVVALVKILASALTIGGGGSAGREGPIVQVGAALGSMLGQRSHLPTGRIIILVAAGSGAGIAATFHAPLAGAIFALEVILVQFTAEAFGYIVISSVMASVIAHLFFGNSPLVDMRVSLDLGSEVNLVWVALVGLLAGLAGMLFSKLLYGVEDVLDAIWARVRSFLHLPQSLCPAFYAVFLGLALYAFPLMYGSGYPVQLDALTGSYTIPMLLLLMCARMIYTSLTIGMGGSGGVFAPTLFIGATLGSACGQLLAPITAIEPAVFGVIGMGAAFAGAARAPLTAVLIIVEMTGQYALMLPLMLAVVIAVGVSRFFTRSTIYTEKLRRRGDILDTPVSHTVVGERRAKDLMNPSPARVRVQDKISRVISLMRESGVQSFPVIDDGGTYVGTVSITQIFEWRSSGGNTDSPVGDLPLTQWSVETVEDASVILRMLRDRGQVGIAVVDGASQKLTGWIRAKDVVDMLYRQQRKAIDQQRSESSWGSRWKDKHRKGRRK
ncbi:chloride channel protein [Actinotignum urinale]|uniref:chloride channel protein n=1 Tax=Actinotignum urinale TaxID=190146 RepID=UPI001FE44FA1|nr:chloride channel protein [Actinotignum urinale]WIK59002.1 chloride channel protein [Actinotignum urinale]